MLHHLTQIKQIRHIIQFSSIRFAKATKTNASDSKQHPVFCELRWSGLSQYRWLCVCVCVKSCILRCMDSWNSRSSCFSAAVTSSKSVIFSTSYWRGSQHGFGRVAAVPSLSNHLGLSLSHTVSFEQRPEQSAHLLWILTFMSWRSKLHRYRVYFVICNVSVFRRSPFSVYAVWQLLFNLNRVYSTDIILVDCVLLGKSLTGKGLYLASQWIILKQVSQAYFRKWL